MVSFSKVVITFLYNFALYILDRIDRVNLAGQQQVRVTFDVDREFMFFIKDNDSNLVSAMGFVRNPAPLTPDVVDRDEL